MSTPSPSQPDTRYPERSFPPGRYPPGRYSPGRYPPRGYLPGRYPPGPYPPGPYSPGRYPDGHDPWKGYPDRRYRARRYPVYRDLNAKGFCRPCCLYAVLFTSFLNIPNSITLIVFGAMTILVGVNGKPHYTDCIAIGVGMIIVQLAITSLTIAAGLSVLKQLKILLTILVIGIIFVSIAEFSALIYYLLLDVTYVTHMGKSVAGYLRLYEIAILSLVTSLILKLIAIPFGFVVICKYRYSPQD